MARKIIQVAVTGVVNNSITQCNHITVALCDDGSALYIRDVDSEWSELPPVPQIKETKLTSNNTER